MLAWDHGHECNFVDGHTDMLSRKALMEGTPLHQSQDLNLDHVALVFYSSSSR